MAVRANPLGAAQDCSHSCRVRFEICKRSRLPLGEILPFAPRSQPTGERVDCCFLMPNTNRTAYRNPFKKERSYT
jgi:hypothetical protein